MALRKLGRSAKDLAKCLRRGLYTTPQALRRTFPMHTNKVGKIQRALQALGFSIVRGLSLKPVPLKRNDEWKPRPVKSQSHKAPASLSPSPAAFPPAPARQDHNPTKPSVFRRVKPLKADHGLLRELDVPKDAMKSLRKILAAFAHLTGKELEPYMLQEPSLLELFIRSRETLSAHTLRKDLFALLAMARALEHPDFTEWDKREAEAMLEEAISELGRPPSQGNMRFQSGAVSSRVAADERHFNTWITALEKKMQEAPKPIDLRKREISTLWIKVTRHLFHQCSALIGFANCSR